MVLGVIQQKRAIVPGKESPLQRRHERQNQQQEHQEGNAEPKAQRSHRPA